MSSPAMHLGKYLLDYYERLLFHFIVNILLTFYIYFNMVTADMHGICHHSVLNVFLTVLKTVCTH